MRIGSYELKLERRLTLTSIDIVKISISSIVTAFAAFSILFLQGGVNPLFAYKEIFSYAFGTEHGLLLTLYKTIFIVLVTLAFILPQKAGLWNIGLPGQLYLGTVGAFGIAYALKDYPSWILIPLMLVFAVLCGGAFGAITGFLRGKMNTNEVLVTTMLNMIAFWFVKYLIEGPWTDPRGESESAPIPLSARAPLIFNVPYTIFLTVGIAVLLHFLFARTKVGYQIRIVGYSEAVARYVGIDFFRTSLLVMFMGGAIAGIAGYHYFTAIPGVYRIPKSFFVVGDISFYGIVCGLIALQNPLAVIPTALFLTGMMVGGTTIQRRVGLSYGADLAFVGVIMLVIVAFQFFYQYRIVRGKGIRKGEH